MKSTPDAKGEVVSVTANYAIIRCKSHIRYFTPTNQCRRDAKAWPLTVGIDVTFIQNQPQLKATIPMRLK